jgi:hypothetical protein
MPFLTHAVPNGGRHVVPPPAAPTAPAPARLRQLLPVGLLVAATSAGVAVAPMTDGSVTADGRSDEDGPGKVSIAARAVPPPVASPGSGLAETGYVLPHAGRHRAPASSDDTEPAARAIGGKHRADGSTATAKHVASLTTSATPATSHATTSAAPAPETRTSAAASPTAGDLATDLTSTMTDLVSGVVDSLLGSPTG